MVWRNMEDRAIKHGPLLTSPQGKLLKRAWQKKYYALYKASSFGVERVEVFDSEDCYMMSTSQKITKIIPLNECIKVVQAPQKNQQNVFEVITKGQAFQLATETTQELAEWVAAFQLVAFGGGGGNQRRVEAVSSAVTPSPHLDQSFPGDSSRSAVIGGNAEEENQIYCSFGEPETYPVVIIETAASAACALRGDHFLVVCPSQLQLLSSPSSDASTSTRHTGASPTSNDHVLLFSWPYRHIRRYGRSSSTFTFEAGRKCASGAGTFSFSTTRGNDIFLSVQANTRNLKREVDGGGTTTTNSTSNLTTTTASSSGSLLGLPLPRAVLSWPSMEDGLLPPPPPSSSPPLSHRSPQASVSSVATTTAAGHTTTSKTAVAKESPPSILDRVLSRTKVAPPFAKPPRRSKLGSPGASEPTTPSSPEPTFRLEISSAARAKLVAEVSAAAAAISGPSGAAAAAARHRPLSDEIYEDPEPTYAQPEVRRDAWKTFGMEGEDFHREKTPDDEYEGFYASVSVESDGGGGGSNRAIDLDAVIPVAPRSAAKTLLPSAIGGVDGYNYDHLSLFGSHQPTSPPHSVSPTAVSSNGHIYSRLTPASTPTVPPMLSFAAAAAVSTADEAGGGASGDIQRFIQNEEVYTAVARKPLKKLSLSSIEV